jgi:hypothetical protein
VLLGSASGCAAGHQGKAGVGLDDGAGAQDTACRQWSAGCKQAARAAGSLRHRGGDAPLGFHLGDGVADGRPISLREGDNPHVKALVKSLLVLVTLMT